jgi:sarcosine oxidase subunit beta
VTTTDTEILIIGGGIAGASAAYHLAQLGHRVALLERGDIASEASGVNAGNIGATGWRNNPNLNSYLTMGSVEIFKSLQLDLGHDIEFRQSGCLEAIQTPEEHEYAQERVSRLRAVGYALELLTNREARSREPRLNPDLPGLVYLPLRCQADPQKATQALADAAATNGASILTGQDVTNVSCQDNGTFRVTTHRGTFQARQLVLAAGAWCPAVGAMLGLKIPIYPVRGQMWATEALPPQIFQTVSATESPFQWQRDSGQGPGVPPELTHQGDRRVTRHMYGRQRRNGEIIFGGDRQLVGFDLSSDTTGTDATGIDATGIEVNRGHAIEIYPDLANYSISRTWSGIMPFSADGKPLIGPIPQIDNLFIVSGLCSSGFGRGPMAGKLLAELMHDGSRPAPLAEANPARCVTRTA